MISEQEEKKIIDAVAKMDILSKIIHLRFFEEKTSKKLQKELNLSVANTK